MIEQYKSQWIKNDDLNDQIAKSELDFIARSMGGERGEAFRGSKLTREIEWYRDNLYGGAGKIDPSGIENKWNFKYMYEAFRMWGVKNMSPGTAFSALKAMEKCRYSPKITAHFICLYSCSSLLDMCICFQNDIIMC